MKDPNYPNNFKDPNYPNNNMKDPNYPKYNNVTDPFTKYPKNNIKNPSQNYPSKDSNNPNHKREPNLIKNPNSISPDEQSEEKYDNLQYPNSYPEDSQNQKPRNLNNNTFPQEIPNDYINTESEPIDSEESSKMKNRGIKNPINKKYPNDQNINSNYPELQEPYNNNKYPKRKNPNKYYPNENIINKNKNGPKNNINNIFPQIPENEKLNPKKTYNSLSKSPKMKERKDQLFPINENDYSKEFLNHSLNKKNKKRLNTLNKEKSFSQTTYFPDGTCWACDLGCSISTTGYSPMTFSPYKNNFRRRDVTPVKEGTKYEQYTRHKKSGRSHSFYN